MSNQVQTQEKWSVTIAKPQIIGFINNALSSKKDSDEFIANLTAVVVNNPTIQLCDPMSIITAGLQAKQNNLSLSPTFGYSYLVPFDIKKKDPNTGQWSVRKVASYQIGYKGMLQLAIRTGHYKNINVIEIKKGELLKYDRISEVGTFKFVENDLEREAMETVGYYAYFETNNGFVKSLYWSIEKMKAHALRYSKAYASDLKNDNSYSYWTTQFDEMGKKTMLRQILSKWGILTTEMSNAIEHENVYVDTEGTKMDVETLINDEEVNGLNVDENTGEIINVDLEAL